jgi:signal transduction histidine kinase/AmiR/NasT family two-component response regulator
MKALKKLYARFPAQKSFIGAVAAVGNDPLLFLDRDEQLLGCNDTALSRLGYDTFKILRKKCEGDISRLFIDAKGCFSAPQERWLEKLDPSESLCVKIRRPDGVSPVYTLRFEPFYLEEELLYVVSLRERTEHEEIENEERRFETVKQQFVSDISHAFRTPMHAISGFADLLERSAPTAVQSEYIRHIQDSASSMMDNVENLLELMRLGTDAVSSETVPFSPFEVFETLADEYHAAAEEKGVLLCSIVDPKLPEKMVGDVEKIKQVLKNLISNAIKYTEKGGQILVEITLKESDENAVVHYAVTDTGIGMPKKQLMSLARPLASRSAMQSISSAPLGAGLTLSSRLLEIMGSSFKVASEVDKGSRFAFTLKHPIVESSRLHAYDAVKAVIMTEDFHRLVQAKILGKYLRLFGVETVEVDAYSSEELKKANVLFIFADSMTGVRLASIRMQYPDLHIVPVGKSAEEKTYNEFKTHITAFLQLPLLPYPLSNVLSKVKNEEAGAVEEERSAVPMPDRSKKRRILFAEDNFINRKLIETILEHHNYEVVAVEDGEKAVAVYKEEPFDLILMDIDMPVMDGIAATNLMREIDREKHRIYTPVIALTAYGLPGDKARIMEAGLDGYMAKPVDKVSLLEAIERGIGIREEKTFLHNRAV